MADEQRHEEGELELAREERRTVRASPSAQAQQAKEEEESHAVRSDATRRAEAETYAAASSAAEGDKSLVDDFRFMNSPMWPAGSGDRSASTDFSASTRSGSTSCFLM